MSRKVRRKADRLLQDAQKDPAGVMVRARAFLADVGDGHVAAAAVAGRALGLATAYSGQPTEALTPLVAAVGAAEQADDPAVLGGVLTSLGFIQSLSGQSPAGHASLERAIGLLDGAARAEALIQRGSLLVQAGEGNRALRDFAAALPLLESDGDPRWKARLLGNRALVWANRGDGGRAEEDLLAARAIFESIGDRAQRAWATHNLGWAAARAGDLPAALTYFSQAEQELADLGLVTGEVLRDRCDALLAAQLAQEARAVANAAVRAFEGARWESGKAEALLRVARAAILQRDYAAAAEAAAAAEELLDAQQRPAWAAGAAVLTVEARRHAGQLDDTALRQVRSAADVLDDTGYALWADEARLVLALVACDLDRCEVAERAIDAVSAARLSPELTVRLSLAKARAAVLSDDRAEASRHLARGLSRVEDIQSRLGSSETRVHVAGLRTELAALGMRLAVARGGARHVLDWIERARAAGLRYPAVRDVAADTEKLSQIRDLEAQLRGGDADDPAAIGARLAGVKAALVADSRRSEGSGNREPRVSVGRIVDAVKDATLVEIGVADERLVRIVVHGGRARLFDACALVDAEFEADAARFALRRLVTPGGGEASRAAAVASFDASIDRLRHMLLGDLPEGGDRLIVVPPPALHAVPWSMMRVGRSVSVVPSADLWVRRASVGGSLGDVVIADGPDLEHAAAETTRLASLHESPTVLSGAAATPDAVLAAVDGADLVHLACHGTFNHENPLFTSLALADGSLTVHDLEQLAVPPRVVVLSACDAGLPAERPGEEILGIVSALLGMGTAAVIAGIGLVPDTVSVIELMAALHSGLRRGVSPAAALAAAQAASIEEGASPATAASFVCFGAG